jgi:hypothetical protein
VEARSRALLAAIEDVMRFLAGGAGVGVGVVCGFCGMCARPTAATHSTAARAKTHARLARLARLARVCMAPAEGGQVAIFDATNTTKERRQMLVRAARERQ